MRLVSIHETKELPQNTRVFTKEEHQGAKHKKHWYQSYHKKAKPYRWPRKTGPSPEGYNEHILR